MRKTRRPCFSQGCGRREIPGRRGRDIGPAWAGSGIYNPTRRRPRQTNGKECDGSSLSRREVRMCRNDTQHRQGSPTGIGVECHRVIRRRTTRSLGGEGNRRAVAADRVGLWTLPSGTSGHKNPFKASRGMHEGLRKLVLRCLALQNGGTKKNNGAL